LDNCGIDDQEFAMILRGLQQMKDFKKIAYRYNIFQRESLAQLYQIISKPIPHHLEELRIENCKIDVDVTRQLVQMLVN